jgi:hypothetical protein
VKARVSSDNPIKAENLTVNCPSVKERGWILSIRLDRYTRRCTTVQGRKVLQAKPVETKLCALTRYNNKQDKQSPSGSY